jgi:hypothetical protein
MRLACYRWQIGSIGSYRVGPMGYGFFHLGCRIETGDPRIIGALAYLNPMLSTLNLVVWGGYSISWIAILAMLLIVSGAAMGSLDLFRKKRRWNRIKPITSPIVISGDDRFPASNPHRFQASSHLPAEVELYSETGDFLYTATGRHKEVGVSQLKQQSIVFVAYQIRHAPNRE